MRLRVPHARAAHKVPGNRPHLPEITRRRRPPPSAPSSSSARPPPPPSSPPPRSPSRSAPPARPAPPPRRWCARVASVTRWAGVVADWMHAAGVSGSRPAAMRLAVKLGRLARPISTTIVSTAMSGATSCSPSSPAWCAVTTANERATPRAVTGIPAAAGPAMALDTPGTTSHRTPACAARRQLLAAPAEHERIAALEPHDLLAGAGPVHQQLVDLLLRERGVARALADIHQLRARPGLVQQLGADQTVVHHDLGPPQQLEPARGDESGVPRAAADEVHRAGRGSHGTPAAAVSAAAAPADAGGRDPRSRPRYPEACPPRGRPRPGAGPRDRRAESSPGSRPSARGMSSAACAPPPMRKGSTSTGPGAPAASDLGEPGLVVDEPGDHVARHPAAAQRLRELERGVPARRMAPGAVPGEEQRRLRPRGARAPAAARSPAAPRAARCPGASRPAASAAGAARHSAGCGRAPRAAPRRRSARRSSSPARRSRPPTPSSSSTASKPGSPWWNATATSSNSRRSRTAWARRRTSALAAGSRREPWAASTSAPPLTIATARATRSAVGSSRPVMDARRPGRPISRW